MSEPHNAKQRRSAAVTRQQILTTASLLFYAQGIRAVGMDTILREVGIGTMTLYRQFPTKDDLVVACVQMQSQAWWDRVQVTQAAAAPDPRSQLLAIFAQLDRDITAPGFRGCPFLNTITEFPDPEQPAHQAALSHKQAVRTYLHEVANASSAADPSSLADALLLLMDGTYETAQAFGPNGPARQTKRLAQTLIFGDA